MPHPAAPAIVLPDPWLIGGYRMRTPVRGDVPALTAAAQDPEIQRHTRVPVPYTTADAEGYVTAAQQGLVHGTAVLLVLTDQSGEGVHGVCGLVIDWRDAVAEVGYWLAPEARGRGMATHATAGICRFGFDLGVGKIALQAAVTNPGSLGVPNRLGFTREGTLRQAGIDGPAGDMTARRVDMHLFGLLPDELIMPPGH